MLSLAGCTVPTTVCEPPISRCCTRETATGEGGVSSVGFWPPTVTDSKGPQTIHIKLAEEIVKRMAGSEKVDFLYRTHPTVTCRRQLAARTHFACQIRPILPIRANRGHLETVLTQRHQDAKDQTPDVIALLCASLRLCVFASKSGRSRPLNPPSRIDRHLVSSGITTRSPISPVPTGLSHA